MTKEKKSPSFFNLSLWLLCKCDLSCFFFFLLFTLDMYRRPAGARTGLFTGRHLCARVNKSPAVSIGPSPTEQQLDSGLYAVFICLFGMQTNEAALIIAGDDNISRQYRGSVRLQQVEP